MDGRFDVYRRLFGDYVLRYWPHVLLAYGSMLLATVLQLLIPEAIAQAIDFGLVGNQFNTVLIAAVIVFGIALIRGLNSFGQLFFSEWLTHRVAYDLRNDFYNAVQALPFAFHDKANTGDLMSRATSDISESERFVGIGLADLVMTILLLIGVSIAMLAQDVRLGAIALIPMPVLVIATMRFGGTVRPLFKDIQAQMGVLSTTMQESMTGIRVVKAFAREPYELEKFDRENDLWFDKRFKLINIWANNWPFFLFLLSINIFLVLWFGGPMAIAGEVTVGSIFALTAYILLLNGPVQRLGFLVNLAATAGASAARVFEIMDMPNEVEDAPDAIALDRIEGRVTFEDVCFRYGEGPHTLQNVSFEAAPGQTIALIGPTGAGKSTVINLIPRFYNASDGRILVDGHDIQQVQMASLRRHVGMVLQSPFLFSASVAENIAYGRTDASMDAIIEAAKAAKAHDFIMSFPDGYDTRVGERGVTLSGGQKQRVAIARALLYDPRILILDDSTSSVDTETEHLIQQALDTLMQGRTTFVIAQRLLTLKNADMILVLDRGEIVERGTHDDLLAMNGLYRKIYDLQLKDQEEYQALETRMATDAEVN